MPHTGGISRAGHRIFHQEKTIAGNRHITGNSRRRERSLRPIVVNACNGHTRSHLDGIGSAGCGTACAGRLQCIAESIGKLHCAGFETVGIDVGNVIANDVHLLLVIFQSGYA